MPYSCGAVQTVIRTCVSGDSWRLILPYPQGHLRTQELEPMGDSDQGTVCFMQVLGAAYPWVARRLLTDTSPELRATLRRLLYDDSGMFRFDRMESLLEQAVQTPPPPRKTRVRAAPRGQDHIRGSQEGSENEGAQRAAASAGALTLLLSEEGDYLRGIMLDELAKGVDAAARVQLDEGTRAVRTALAGFSGGQGGPAEPEGAAAGAAASAVGAIALLGGPVVSAAEALSQRVSALPAASDASDREQVCFRPGFLNCSSSPVAACVTGDVVLEGKHFDFPASA